MQWIWPHLDVVAARLGLHPNVVLVFAVMFALMVLGTIERAVRWRLAGDERARHLLRRLTGWWALAVVFVAAVAAPPWGVIALLALISVIGLREYGRMLAPEARDSRLAIWLCASIPIHYGALWCGRWDAVMLIMPLAVLLVIAVRLIAGGVTEGFVRRLASAYLGWVLTVYCVSYVALLALEPEATNPVAGSDGWVVFYILLVEGNDIAQALWGRTLGGPKVTPRVSPHKTWSGTMGGVVTTLLLAMLLAPLLTPLDWKTSAAILGLLIGVVGFFSDLTISAIKRDAHVKDSGTLLPEQGGILDRVDSIIFTAPMFVLFIHVSATL